MGEVEEAAAMSSAEWWRSRTQTELRDLMRGGFAAGDGYLDAQAELERRAEESTQAAERAKRRPFEQRRKRAEWIVFAIAAASLLLAIAAFVSTVRR